MPRSIRPPMEPNAALKIGETGTRAEYLDETSFDARAEAREDRRIADELYQDQLPQRQADAARATPRTLEDAANPRMARDLPAGGELRKNMTSRRKKDMAKHKREWSSSLAKTRFGAVKVATENYQRFEQLNEMLAATAGDPNNFSPSVRRQVRQLDLAIQDFERDNPREHIVYSPGFSPYEAGSSREAYLRRIQGVIDDDGTMDFDRYIAADHSLSNLEEDFSSEIVFEIKTRSGAYVGSSDTLPDAMHILPRGRQLKPVAIQRDVPYVKADGTTGTWKRVVQFEDVTTN